MHEAVALGWWGVPVAVIGGAIRSSTPFLFVSIGECLTEKSGRINIGLEGNLVMGAMSAYGIAYLSGSPWLGIFVAGIAGMLLGVLHAWACSRPRVNDIAVGIALMLFGTGLAFFLGKPFVEPKAPNLASIELGWWSDVPQVQAALKVNVLFIIGIILVPILDWVLRNTRWGLIVRTVGDSDDTARASGFPINRVRMVCTAIGGFSLASAARFCRCIIPGAGTKGYLVVRASWLLRSSSSRAGSPGGVFTPRCFSAVPAPLDPHCSRWESLRATIFSMQLPTCSL